MTRHRKAFYEKENDYRTGNQKLELYKSFDAKHYNQHPDYHVASQSHKIPQLLVKKLSKNDTELYCEVYADDLLKDFNNFQIPVRFLEKHKIDSGLRARMLDWMV